MAQEANERTIEDSTGSAPSQCWFEGDDDYRQRVAREADERTIEGSTGSASSQGWFESDDTYRERIHREANECTVKDLTGSAPAQGWFEADQDYDTRIRKEANEQIVNSGTGSSPKQSWFESSHDYRSRIAHEAREVKYDESGEVREAARGFAARKRKRGDSDSKTNGGWVAIVGLLLVILLASLTWSTWLPYVLAAVFIVILCCLMWPLIIASIVFGVAAYLALWVIIGQQPI